MKAKHLVLILAMVLSIAVVGNYLWAVVPSQSLRCESVRDCPQTVKFFGATLTGASCTIDGYCAYDTCIDGCTDKICKGYNLNCPQTGGCGDGVCSQKENCVNCPDDCGKCCVDGERKDCTCKGRDKNSVYCYVCQNGVWSSTDYHIETCGSDEICKNGKCVEKEGGQEKECTFHIDCAKLGTISKPYCKNERVYQLQKFPLCLNGKCYTTKKEKLVEDCVKEGKVCKNGACVKPTKQDREEHDEIFARCGEQICVYRNRIGACLSQVTINKVCEGDSILYDCETGKRIDCREKGYEGCSMTGRDGKPSDGHCYGKSSIIPPSDEDTKWDDEGERSDVECYSDEDCSSGQICNDGDCVDDLEVIKCSDDSDCMEKLGEVRCWAYCDSGICKVGKISYPEKPCKNAEWDMESCSWDVSLCEVNEQKCPENEILTKDGKCTCKEGFTRIGGHCIEKGKIAQAGVLGGVTLFVGGLLVVIVLVGVVLVVVKK